MNLLVNQQAPQSAEGEAKVITLCGLTKFEAEFAEVNQRLTMEGCVVISLGMFQPPLSAGLRLDNGQLGPEGRLGDVHVQEIRMADDVYIGDPVGYLGESTRREVAYAESLGKPVRYRSRERSAQTGDGPKSESDRAVRSSLLIYWWHDRCPARHGRGDQRDSSHRLPAHGWVLFRRALRWSPRRQAR
jgi:hypothetical protein